MTHNPYMPIDKQRHDEVPPDNEDEDEEDDNGED